MLFCASQVNLEQFFENIVGEELYQYTLGRQYSALVLAACGSAVTIPSALTGLQKVTEKYVFSPPEVHTNLYNYPPQIQIFRCIRLCGAGS